MTVLKKNDIPRAENNEELLRWHSDVFLNKEQGEKIYRDIRKNFKTSPHPFCGWRGFPNQNLDTIITNRYGLRSPDFDFNQNKKKICILLGGSLAWGYGATKNENTPAFLIKEYLNKLGQDFEIVCLAQNSHNSFDELRSFISYVDELKPKLVITLSGVNDIWQVAKRNYNKNQLLHSQVVDFFNWGQSIKIISHYKNKITGLIRFLLFFFFSTDKRLEHDFYQFGYQDNIPIKLLEHKITVMNAYCEIKNIKAIHVLQPHLFFKKEKSKTEQNYLDFWIKEKSNEVISYENFKYYLNYFKDNFYLEEKNTKNTKYISSLDFFDDCKQSIFFDVAHISDEGNKILSKKIVSEINNFL